MPKFKADVAHMTARSDGTDPFVATATAETEMEAARAIADLAARRKFGTEARATYLVATKRGFRAFIGVPVKRSQRGYEVTRGVTILFQLQPVE